MLFVVADATPTAIATGPDVIVGELFGDASTSLLLNNYGSPAGNPDVAGYTVGTISCNVGDAPVGWIQNTNQHPVIGANMYRLKNGRFEQIGMSWVKHGYLALAEQLCSGPGGCTAPPSSHPDFGRYLFPGCSDPYSATLNGTQARLGPRSNINASTGAFSFPYSTIGQHNPADPLWKRIRLNDADLSPSLNAGALYYIEGQYISADDAAAGNGLNNASYRRVLVSETSPGVFTLTLTDSTEREQYGIRAWKANDPAVVESSALVPNDGLFNLSAKATDLGGGMWHYEYALHNFNSHRSGQAFTVPLPQDAIVSNTGFHDCDHHGGDGEPYPNTYSGTDWPVTILSSSVSWATTPHATNANANALRWGTLYNFWFDCDHPPTTGDVTMALFRPGSPASVTFSTLVPGPPIVEPVPTVSEWGLMLIGLLLLSAGTVVVTSIQPQPAAAGRTPIGPVQPRILDAGLYLRVLPVCLAIAALGLLAAFAYFGELALRDAIGSALCACAAAHTIHLWILSIRD